jgi:hypothetical protein
LTAKEQRSAQIASLIVWRFLVGAVILPFVVGVWFSNFFEKHPVVMVALIFVYIALVILGAYEMYRSASGSVQRN